MKRICDERINRGREISRLNASGLLIAAAIALSGPCSTAEAGTPDIMVLHSFGATVGDGATPSASVVLGNDGNFYGTTEYGGTYGYGTVFKITSSGSLTTLYSFGTVPHDGGLPAAGLIQAQDGKFYGTTASGGAYDYGTVFNITTSGSLTTQFSFYYAGDIGFAPQASLVQDSDGSFYGTTAAGGAYINGTVFKITPSGSEFTLHSFTGIADNGSSPCAGLVQGRDGNFYGTTIAGGVGGGYGTVFTDTCVNA